MKAAFVLYDGVTMLDFVGMYDPITRLKSMGFKEDLTWDICGFTEHAADTNGLTVQVDKVRPSLAEYDLILIPGGFSTRTLQSDPAFKDWLQTMNAKALIASVCSGSLLLGGAGYLTDRKATTHPNARTQLKVYCNTSAERVVDEGQIVTARGVSSSIDLGLYLCRRFAGEKAAEAIKIQMDYEGDLL
nr:DJ-1/PfpI family protein [Alkalicoccus halolimnae]TXF85477.1 DJ-1/PfpI family protein [Alkalicoccus halolimnae]